MNLCINDLIHLHYSDILYDLFSSGAVSAQPRGTEGLSKAEIAVLSIGLLLVLVLVLFIVFILWKRSEDLSKDPNKRIDS